jgi:hypothetical protein
VTEYWRQYGHSLRLILLSCAVSYDLLGGLLVLVRWSDYGHPTGQLVLWACCAALALHTTLRTRGPGYTALPLILAVLVAYVLGNLDLTDTSSVLGAWSSATIGLALGVLLHSAPMWCSITMVVISTAVIHGTLLAIGAPSAFASPVSLGPVFGVLPGFAVMLLLARRARRNAEKCRQQAMARDAERAVLQDRGAMLKPVMSQVVGLLTALADGAADPTDPEVRRTCAEAERQLRAALLATTTESGLALLAQRLQGSASTGMVLVAQGDESWDQLPEGVRVATAELLHTVLAQPELRRTNITALPEGDRIWLSLTCDGGTPPAELPIELARPSARGADGGQWWLEWILLPDRANSEDTRERAGRDRTGTPRSGADRRPFHVPRWRGVLAGERNRWFRPGGGHRGDGRRAAGHLRRAGGAAGPAAG